MIGFHNGHVFSCNDNMEVIYVGNSKEITLNGDDAVSPCSDEIALVFVTALTSGLSLDKLIVVLPNGSLIAFCKNGRLYGAKEIKHDEKLLMQSNGLCFYEPPSNFELFDRYPMQKFYIQNYGDAALALGKLLFKLVHADSVFNPHHFRFYIPNSSSCDGISTNYEDFENDAAGKMARDVLLGNPVLSERFSEIGKSAYYGRVLLNRLPLEDHNYLVSRKLDSLFPNLSVSWRYAAACLPLKIRNTEEFSKVTKDTSEFVEVKFLSQFDSSEMHSFIQFLNIMSGRLFVYSCEKDRSKSYNNMVIYRYNHCYRMEK